MADPALPLDAALLRARPLPPPRDDVDKNERGRVLAIGGSLRVPGGLALSCEAALRAGAGKVRAAVPASLAVPLGLAMPELGILALPEADGEIGAAVALTEECGDGDAVLAGPAMNSAEAAQRVVAAVMGADSAATLIFDAAVLAALTPALRERRGAAILTPHVGEMAQMLYCSAAEIEADRERAVRHAAEVFGAVVVLKGPHTLVAAPDGALFVYPGGGVGLATSGSGDVQAGIVAGLAARGASALDAALWAVWLHGEAGRRCAAAIGKVGYLARELLPYIPALLDET
ncbi:MAG: NAD(P)H-hydrate dehydratase [Novosphingobium sp.]